MLTKDNYTLKSLAKWGWGKLSVEFSDKIVFSFSFFVSSPRHHAPCYIIIVHGLIISTGGYIYRRRIDLNTLIGAFCSQIYLLIANINYFKSRCLGLRKIHGAEI